MPPQLVPYDTHGGFLPATLVGTHIPLFGLLVVLAYIVTVRHNLHAAILFVHFLLVGITSPLWHVCSSYDWCPAPEASSHQILDHFTSLTAIPLLLIFGMPALPLTHRATHTLLAYLLHAHDMAGDPEHYQDARLVVYVYGAIYVLHHHAVYTAAGTAAVVAAHADAVFFSLPSSHGSPALSWCASPGRIVRAGRRVCREPRTLSFTNLSVQDLAMLFLISVVAAALYGVHVSSRAAGYVHAAWHVVAFVGASIYVILVVRSEDPIIDGAHPIGRANKISL